MKIYDKKTGNLISERCFASTVLNIALKNNGVVKSIYNNNYPGSGGVISGIRFEDCSFYKLKFDSILSCTFVNCSFKDCTFIDIIKCTLDDNCTFANCKLVGNVCEVTSNWTAITNYLAKIERDKKRVEEVKSKPVYKYAKADVLVELELLPESKYVRVDNKSKTDKAIVKNITLLNCLSKYDNSFEYEVGKVVTPKAAFDPSPTCSSGIFFCEDIEDLKAWCPDSRVKDKLKSIIKCD